MAKTTFAKVCLITFVLLQGFISYSQTFKPFSPRFDSDVKGSMVMIGNNILGKDNNPYNINSGALSFNENIDMKYIDIDGDPTTFSSSSADLIIPNPQCFKIVYAGLYWGALLQTGSRSDINKIKLKIPGSPYQDVTGEVIYDADVAPIGTNADKPYACYADITALVQGATNPIGTYTVANITSSLGFNGTTGLAAGWNLIVIYEDPTKSAQSITTFDGFSAVSNGETTVFDVSGFRSRPAGAVNLAFGIAGLEGDKDEVGSKLEINGKAVTTAERPSNHFFNSTINNLAGDFTARNPNGSNTLGFDSGIISVPNPQQTVVGNNATSAKISLQMAPGKKGTYYSYFNVFAIDIIAPEIVLTKQVQDAQGNDASTADVVLGQNLFYVIGFQNIGNDPATQFTIRDVLPNNIIFNYPADITYLPPGVTATYDAATRSITFSIDKTLVEIGDPRYEIRFKVQVVPTCNQLSSACSNEIKNQAFATYRGVENPMLVTDDPSLPSYTTCNITTAPSATNFLVGVSGCSYGDSQVLCGNNVLLTASNGYASYSWSRDPSGVPVIGTGQTYLATQLGKYYVHNTAAPPCFLNIVEEITVVPFGNTVTNPVIPFADNVVECSNDGKSLPFIYLCGANATRAIQTNVSDGSTIVWEKLNEASCAAVSNFNCANENSACTWTQVGTGPDYTATAAGQYRMTLNYPGGCFNRFYFNVYQNLLSPTVTKKDIVCNTPGRITVGGVPSDYEYSLSPTGPFQSSNVFDIPTQNLYTVYIRQVGVTSNPCLFTVPDIFIRERNFTVSTVATAPLCNGGKGSLKLAANDVEPQYFYKISQGGVLINSVGPILASDYTFANLNSGVYDVEVSTEDGCIQAFQATVPDTPPLTATVTLTKPLTCTDGEITVYPVGGTAPYTYFVNNSTNYETSPVIAVPTAGVYTIDVFDANSCTTRVSISVAGISPPTFDVEKTDLSCSSVVGDGTISLTNIVPNGNALRYSIDNGVTFLNSPIFTGLTAGNYNVVVEYSVTYATGTSVCTTPPQSISITFPMAITGTATLTVPYTCLQTATIEAQNVSGGTGVYQYSINGTTFQASNVFTGLTDGTYTITIKDANNCTFVTNAVTVAPLTPPTNLDFSATDLTCLSNTSNVTLSATGGSGVKMYQITAPAGFATAYQESNVFSGLAPGTYTFQIKDEKDCTYQESYSIAPLPTVAVVGQVVSNVQCFGTNTGSVLFTVSGSTGFTYTINGTPQGVGTSPINLVDQAAGTYAIVITDSSTNCTATTSVTIAQPAEALSVTTTVTPIKCNANGSVVVNAKGGWGSYSYTLTQPDATVVGPQPSNTFANLTQPETYTVSVTDANNCTVTDTFTLTDPVLPTASIAITSDFCYDGTNGASLVVTASGGVAPYEYSSNGGAWQSSNTFSNLTPNTYTITVRDAYGCPVTLPAQTIAPQLSLNAVLTKELDCTSSPNAVITGTITGGYTSFSYQVKIDGGIYGAATAVTENSFTYSTAVAGTYQFRVTDSQGCQSVSNVIIVTPKTTPTFATAKTNISCFGGNDGSVVVTASPVDGIAPFQYSKDGGTTFQASNVFAGLFAGTYTIVVKDNKGCDSVPVDVVITQPVILTASSSITTPLTCGDGNAAQPATVTVTGIDGAGGYQYSFDGGVNYSATNTYQSYTGITFDVWVKDANGCTYKLANGVDIPALNPPTDLTFTEPISVNCTEVKVTVTNGVEPLTYEITFPAAISNNTGIFPNLAAGTYVFKVTDANGCYYTESYTVTPIAVSGLKIADVKCFGDNDGAIQYTVSGNAIIENYTYTLTSVKGTTIVPVQTGNTLDVTGLIADIYTMTVTDNDTGCTAFSTIEITEPTEGLSITSAIPTNVHCNNYNSQITVTASGGTANYTYAAVIAGEDAPTTYGNSNIITVDTNSGTNLSWDIYVKDANGCITNNTLSPTMVTLDPMPTVTTTPLPTDQCDSNGSSYSFTATGTGVAPLTYSIGGSFQASPTFNVTATGLYTITVKDGNGCTDTIDITVYPVLTATAVLTKDLTCTAPADATITVNAAGGTGTYSYKVSINGGSYNTISLADGNTYTASSPGTYQFEITDANGCTKVSNSIIINPIVPPVIDLLTQTQEIYCNGDATAAITVAIDNTKGIAPFTYSIDGLTFQASNVFSGLAAGDYIVTLKDSKGCTVTDDITINQPPPINVKYHVVEITCDSSTGKSKGSIIIDGVTGGTKPYNYFVTGVNGYYAEEFNMDGDISTTFDVVDFGLYQINVVDANGCSFLIQNVLVASPPEDLVIQIDATVDCLVGGTAEITLGGTLTGPGPFYFNVYTGPGQTYSALDPTWIPEDEVGSKHATITSLIPGVTYTFIVYDSDSGCYYYEIADAPIPTNSDLIASNLVPKNITCKGEADGKVSFDITSTYSSPTNVSYEIFNSLSLVSTGIRSSGTIPANGTLSVTDLGNLPFGNYIVVIKEDSGSTNAGCSIVTDSFNITESAFDLEITASVVQNANCDNDGIVSAQAKHGTAPYLFMISTSATPPLADDISWASSSTFNVPAEDYYVYVQDAYGCIKSTTVQTVPLDPSPEIALAATDNCAVEGAFEITVSETTAGVAPYAISVNGSAYQNFSFVSGTPNSYTISNLNSGTYNISVKDVNGCIATESITLYKKVSVIAELTKEFDCTTSPNAVITTTISNGLAPFTYRANIDGVGYVGPNPVTGTSFTVSIAPTTVATTYQFEITDANDCIVETTEITIEPIENPTATTIITNATCSSSANGSVTIISSLGVPPYTFSFNGSGSFTSDVTYGGLAGSVAGIDYNYQVKDSYGCIFDGTATVFEPTPVDGTIALTQGLTCGAGNASQAATVTVTPTPGSGTAPYYYSFDGGLNYSSNPVYTTNVAGDVSALIKDGNGCVIAAPLIKNVPALNPPTDLIFTQPVSVNCTTVQATATNGVGTLTYEITFPAAAAVSNNDGVFPNLAAGTYIFKVTDANGCYYIESYTVTPIAVSGLKIADVKCFGDNTGAIKYTVSGNAIIGNYTYTLTSVGGTAIVPVQTGNTLDVTGLISDTYTMTVTDKDTGCTAFSTIEITEPTAGLSITSVIATNVHCNNDNSQITVTATGGTPNYTYAVVKPGDLVPEVFSASNILTVDTNSGADLLWDVYVKDLNGCVSPLEKATVILDPMPTVSTPALASNQCTVSNGFTFTAVGASGIPPYEYSIGNGYQASPMFVVAVPAVPTSYTVSIKDANGCMASDSITIYPPLDLTPAITALPSCTNNDGVITIAPAGGSGFYSYAINPSEGITQATNVFSNVPSGPYIITITDTTTNCSKDTTVTLSPATPVSFDPATVTDVSCFGGNNGTIMVNLASANDNPIYSYTLTATSGLPLTVGPQGSNVFPNLIARSYDITVTSGRNCTATQNVSVTEPATALTVTAIATPFDCAVDNSVNTSTVTITEVGGTSTYVYSIDGTNYFTSNTFSVIDNGSTQIITVYVKDKNGCTANNTVTIDPLPKLISTTVSQTTAISCLNPELVSISVTGGSGNLTYQLLPNGTSQDLNSFTLTTPGTYYFQVNDVTTGCYIATLPYTVAPYNTIDVVATATTPVTCFGDANGAISINVTGYTGAFDYEVFDNLGNQVSNGSGIAPTSQLISGLSGGNFTVNVTEIMSPFCAKTSNVVTVASPALPLAVAANETASVSCANNQGTITATGTGGWGSLQYELVGPINVAYSTSSTFNNLVAGNYTVNVKDAKGCIRSSNLVQLSVPTPITATATPNTVVLLCFGDKNAIITVSNVTGGQGSNYAYTLNMILPTATSSGPQASSEFTGLGAGTYTVTVTDGYNCSFTSANIVIGEPTVVKASLVVASTQTCFTQTQLTLTANGGTGPYTFSADNVTYSATPFAASVTFPVPVGTYLYYVKDANDCVATVSNDIKIDPLPPLVINLDLTNAVINCAGDNTGVIVATAQGGLGNYIYTLQDTSGNNLTAVQASPGVFTQLFAGTYQVKVDSGDCATTSSIITITQPLAPLVATYTVKNVTCNGANNGSIVINASGGTGIIKYAISPRLDQFFDSGLFENLVPGDYQVVIQDQNGCFAVYDFEITEPFPLMVSTIVGSIVEEICAGDKDAAFSIEITGGTAPYSVSLDDINGTYTSGTLTQTDFDFSGLNGGNHFVFIRDANGCTTDWLVALPEAINMNPTALVQYDCVGNAAANSVTITVDASITDPTDVDYALDGSGVFQPSNVFTNLTAGFHFVTARHSNGCEQQTMNFEIAQVDPLTLVLNDGGLNEIVAVTAGGGGNYKYTFDGENYGSTANFIIYKSGDYTVTVTDAYGCVTSATRYFEYIDVCVPNNFTPNGDGINDNWAPGCTVNYKNLTFEIFDRYGRKVGNYRLGQYWDGKYNGTELPSGDYWYVFKLNDVKDPREFVGHFTLYR